MKSIKTLLFTGVLSVFLSFTTFAQRYYGVTGEEFGKSKIQKNDLTGKPLKATTSSLISTEGGGFSQKSSQKSRRRIRKSD